MKSTTDNSVVADFDYASSEHFANAQAGSNEAERIYQTQNWCFIHGMTAELLRRVLPSDLRAQAMARELLAELHKAAIDYKNYSNGN